MHIDSVTLTGFKRFTDTTIKNIPITARLVVLAGPNGSGKSSLFDGFRTWHSCHGGCSSGWDADYGKKVGAAEINWTGHVELQFHEDTPTSADDLKRLFYIRSAFRNEADFRVTNFARMASPLDSIKVVRLIDNDASVSDNYQRMLMQTMSGVYSLDDGDPMTVVALRDELLGEVRAAMRRVFPNLLLKGIGDVLTDSAGGGTFLFDKGDARGFMYKNLSAGEKAVFDLILDAVVKKKYFNNSIWCIDEPESHLNTRLQGLLLETLLDVVPDGCQLWIASHSIGFMRKAWHLAKGKPGSVSFLDMQDIDFDTQAILEPVVATRDFWERTLDVALGELAELIAPEQIVLCEGKPQNGTKENRASFDAKCYQRIFSLEFPNTDFISIGNSDEVANDRLELGKTITALVGGVDVVKLRDRDMCNAEEVVEMEANGIRVLRRRNIEAYLFDDEIIAILCETKEKPELITEALRIKTEVIDTCVKEGNDAEDLKKAASEIYNRLRVLLDLKYAGANWRTFARDTLAPLIHPGSNTYAELREDIFGK